jgi:rod shape-determining protein MreD
MKNNVLIPFLLLIPVLILQMTVIPFLSFNGISPDLILILLVFYTIRNNQMYGTIAGFIIGGICDLAFGTILGSTMIAKTLSGFIAGYFSSENKRDSYLTPLNFSLIIFLVGIIDNSIFSFFSSFDLSENFISSLLTNTIMSSVYTAIISIFIMIAIPKRRLFE